MSAATTGHAVYPGGPPCNPNCLGEHSMYHDGYADGYEAAEQPVPPLDVERLRQHEPEPGMGNYATWRWDCSCGWYDNDSDAQKWWTHVLGSEAP